MGENVTEPNTETNAKKMQRMKMGKRERDSCGLGAWRIQREDYDC